MKRILIAVAAALTLGMTTACMHGYHHGGAGGPGGPCCQKRHCRCENCPDRANCPDCPNCRAKQAPGADAPPPVGKPCCPQAAQPPAK